MQTNPPPTDSSKRRPRGDMYLRAEQRHQAEAAAARLTEILTPSVPSVYGDAEEVSPFAAPAEPVAETLATTTSVGGVINGVVAPPPVTATVWDGLTSDVVDLPSPAMEQNGNAALAVSTETVVPVSPIEPPSVTVLAAGERVLESRPAAAPGPDEGVLQSPPDAVPATGEVARPQKPHVTARGIDAPVQPIIVATTPVRAATHVARRRTLQSLLPAAAFVIIALVAGFAIVGTLRSSGETDAEAAAVTPVAQTAVTPPASQNTGRAAVPAPESAPGAPAPRPPSPSVQTPAAAAAVATAARPEPPAARTIQPAPAQPQTRRPELTQAVRRPDAAPVSAAAAGERPAAVTPVHTASEGQLRITSTPSGARVTVNGIGWGQTPLTLAHLPLGPKTVRVTQTGYASQERLVDLRGDSALASVHMALRRTE